VSLIAHLISSLNHRRTRCERGMEPPDEDLQTMASFQISAASSDFERNLSLQREEAKARDAFRAKEWALAEVHLSQAIALESTRQRYYNRARARLEIGDGLRDSEARLERYYDGLADAEESVHLSDTTTYAKASELKAELLYRLSEVLGASNNHIEAASAALAAGLSFSEAYERDPALRAKRESRSDNSQSFSAFVDCAAFLRRTPGWAQLKFETMQQRVDELIGMLRLFSAASWASEQQARTMAATLRLAMSRASAAESALAESKRTEEEKWEHLAAQLKLTEEEAVQMQRQLQAGRREMASAEQRAREAEQQAEEQRRRSNDAQRRAREAEQKVTQERRKREMQEELKRAAEQATTRLEDQLQLVREELGYPVHWRRSLFEDLRREVRRWYAPLLGSLRISTFECMPVDKSGAEFATLASLFNVPDPHNLGMGRDVPPGPWRQPASGSDGQQRSLRLVSAWSIENPFLWSKYQAERRIVSEQLARLHAGNRTVDPVSTNLFGPTDISSLNITNPELRAALNESLLSHGVKPDSLLDVIGNGLSDKFCSGLFGHGIYLADSISKNDQYAIQDEKYNGQSRLRDLHARLYNNSNKHPGKVYYVLVCRAILGCAVRTQDNQTIMGSPGSHVYAVPDRELAHVDGNYADSRIHHHSLVGETGVRTQRHREFIQFHKERVYPWYLLAYQRVLNGNRV